MSGAGFVQGVLIPVRVCAFLDAHLPLTELRGRTRGDDPEIDQVLLDLRRAAMAYTGRGTATTDATPARPAMHWLTPTQAAARLGVAPDTVRRGIREHRLPAEKHDGHWRIPSTALDTYLGRTA